MGRPRILTDEQRLQYNYDWKRKKRLERGLQKQGRKPLTEEQKILSREKRKLWEKENRVIYQNHSPQKRLLYAAKHRSNLKGLPFNIDESDIIIPTHCPYLGIPLRNHTPRGECKHYSVSLDRIVPELGYVKGNVEVLSNLANSMKSNATPEQLISFAKEVLKRYDTHL